MAFLVGGANTLTAGYNIDNSLRYNDGDNPMLSFSMGSGNQQIFTVAAWVKRGGLTGDNQRIFSSDDEASADWRVRFNGANKLEFVDTYSGDSNTYTQVYTTRLFRDTSAWYHIVVAVDTTQGTASNRVKIYVNGVQATDLDDGTGSSTKYPAEDANLGFGNSGDTIEVGSSIYGGSPRQSFDGYIAEVYVVDGTQYAASNFGEFDEDSGIWKPKDAKDDLTFGTNGFYLEFKNSAVGTGASDTIGADTSGNDNHLTSTNVAVTDQCTDTPTNNFATFNPLMTFEDIVSGSDSTLLWSEGNTTVTGEESSGTNYTPSVSSIGVSNGKWYYEFYSPATDSGTKLGGVMDYDFSADGQKDYNDAFYGIIASNGTFYYNGSNNASLTNATEWKDSGDILSVALNLDDMEISFSTNGASYTAAQSITGNAATSGTLHPVVYQADNEITTVNFGNPNWALSSGVADANGYGNFEYAPPSGYFALCTKNLAEFG